MSHDVPAYGLWSLVIIESLIFIVFAMSFAPPKSKRDWRSFGAFSAFIVALFAEMYGFPLTIFLLSGWLASRFPGINLYGHEAGHLWHTIFGLKGDPHLDVLHVASNLAILAGFLILGSAWRVLYDAQKHHTLATTRAYALVRHPQYDGFVLIMFGFLLQWPTLPTLLMFPVLVTMYVRLAHREEREMRAEFGEAYDRYAASVPAFLPHLGPTAGHGAPRASR